MKNSLKKIGVAVAVLVVVGVGAYYFCPYSRSQIKKSLCEENPAFCHCYENVVDYRFTKEDVKLLSLMQKEIKERQQVNALEFASIQDVQHLRELLMVCQPQVIQQQPVAQPRQVQQQPVAQAQPAQQAQKTATKATKSTKK